MAKSLKKLEAIKLRQSGLSIKDISSKIQIARSTVSVWCSGVVLSKEQQEKLYKKMIDSGHKGRMMGAEVNKQKKLDVLDSVKITAKKEIGRLSKRDVDMLSLGLYWGEGLKDKQGRFNFVNSDPATIQLIVHWLKISMNINSDSLQPQIYINDQHAKRLEVVLSFWSKKLKLPKSQFRKTVLISVPRKKIYTNHETYMGVLHLTVSKSSTLKYQTMAFLSTIQEHVQKI